MKTGIIVAWKSSLQSTFGQTEYYMRRVKAKLAKAAVNTSQLILMKIKHCELCEQCFTFIFLLLKQHQIIKHFMESAAISVSRPQDQNRKNRK